MVVVFYLLKRKRVVRLVSSTLLWQKFLADAQANSPFQKLRHNWLLVLQLLLLALAILALSRPYFAGHTTASDLRVVILDASASMQSTDEEPSRFEKAREEALALVKSLKDQDQMVVLLAGGNTEVKQSATSSKADLRRAILDCQVSDSSTRLTEALKLAETLLRDGNRHDPEIHLFSDGAAGDLSEFARAREEFEGDLSQGGQEVPTTWASRRWTCGRIRRTARSGRSTPAWPIFRRTRSRRTWSFCLTTSGWTRARWC